MALRSFESIRRATLSCLSAKPGIQAAYIFGSVASGRTRPDSDVDIAVLVSERVLGKNPFRYRLQLMTDLMGVLKRDDVDLIILNQAPPLLAHRVLSTGKLILENSASARVAFQVRAVNRYLDSQPMRNTYLAYLKQQVRAMKARG